MRVKATTTITHEFDLDIEDYADIENGPKTEDEIIAWELREAADPDYCSGLMEALITEGALSDIKIEKLEETAPAEKEEAA